MALPLQAQVPTTWTGPGTDFYTAGNWTAPGIGPGGLATINTTGVDSPIASTNPGYALDQLFIGSPTGSGELAVGNGGVINITTDLVGGDAHAGDLNVGFGIVDTPSALTGTLNMTGNAQVSAANGSVGNCWSTGYLNMYDTSNLSIGGAFVVGGNLRGDYGGVNGQWSVSTGYMTMGTLGNLADSPSMSAINLYVGLLSSTGSLTLNGRSSVQIAGDTEIGYYGTGSLVVNDQATLNTTSLEVGNLPGGACSLTINGGTVNVNGGSGYVGVNGGNGTLLMTGGVLNAVWTFQLGAGAGSSGLATINGGTLNAVGLNVGNGCSATLNVGPGGTVNYGWWWGNIGLGGGTGIVNTSGTVSAWRPDYFSPLYLGNGGTAVWNQNGGITSASSNTYYNGVGTLNLNGGVYATTLIQGGAGASLSVVFNGGTLQALSSQPNFINDAGGVSTLSITSLGGTFDTNGFDVVLQQPLQAASGISTGGLIKTGLGNLTLADGNTYTGDTNVNAGTLILGGPNGGPVFTVSNTVNVATNAAVGVPITYGGGGVFTPSITNASLVFANNARLAVTYDGTNVSDLWINDLNAAGQIVVDLAASRSVSAPPTAVSGVELLNALTVSAAPSSVIPRFADVGVMDVSVSYNPGLRSILLTTTNATLRGWLGGAGPPLTPNNWSYTNGLPPSNPLFMSNWGSSSSGSSYDPVPNSVNSVAWFNTAATGTASPTCVLDMNATVNSMLFYASGAPAFSGYDIVRGPTGHEAITLSATGSTLSSETQIQVLGGVNTIAPNIYMTSTPTIYLGNASSLTINGALLQGSTDGLNIIGDGTSTLTLANTSGTASDYTGPVSIDSAVVNTDYLTPGNILLKNGATLTYTGSAGGTVSGGLTSLQAVTSLNVTGSGAMTVPLDNSVFNPGVVTTTFPFGNPGVLVTGGSGTLILDYNTPNVEYMKIPNLNVTAGNTVVQSRAPGAVIDLALGYGGYVAVTGSGTLTLRSTAATTFTTPGAITVGDAGAGTTGLNIFGATTAVSLGNVAAGWTSASVILGTTGAVSGADGVANMHVTDATVNCSSEIIMGLYGGTGNLLVDGNAHIITNNIEAGYQWGIDPVADVGTGHVTIAGNARVDLSGVIVIGSVGGSGTWDQNGGTTTAAGGVCVGQGDYEAWNVLASGEGTLTLTHGVLATPFISNYSWGAPWTTSSLVQFNGGTLQATTNSADFIDTGLFGTPGGNTFNLMVLAGGAVIDTNGFNVTLLCPLQSGAASDGGLTKLGAGTLALGVSNTYNGPTTVNAGTLALGVANAIPATPVVVNGGELALGVNSATVTAVTLNNGAITGTGGVLTSTVGFAVKSGSASAILDGVVALTKTTTGTVTLTGANTYTGATVMSPGSGTLKLVGAGAMNPALNLGGLAQGGGLVVFDYTSVVTPNPINQIRTDLASGKIYDPTAPAGVRIGYWDSGTAVTAKPVLAGDVNGDGVVNITDLGLLAANWNLTGKYWADGDFNYDGTVNISDLGLLAANWNKSYVSPGALPGMSFSQALASVGLTGGVVAPVPEPGTLALLLLAALGLGARLCVRKQRG